MPTGVHVDSVQLVISVCILFILYICFMCVHSLNQIKNVKKKCKDDSIGKTAGSSFHHRNGD